MKKMSPSSSLARRIQRRCPSKRAKVSPLLSLAQLQQRITACSSTRPNAGGGGLKLTCPVCFEVVHEVGRGGEEGSDTHARGGGKVRIVAPPGRISCPGCSKKFRVSPDNNYFDLTVLPSQAHDDDPGSSVVSAVADALTQSTSNSNSSEKDLADAYKEKLWSVSKLFQSPVISYVYERGWRQGFDWAGFPGADEEFALLQKLYFGEGGGSLAEANKEEREGDEKRSVLDVSCGTGLFSRKFLKSGKFETIVASDYSENMLKQAYSFLEKEEDSKDAAAAAANNGTEIDPSVLLVRADVGRLPFPSKTFDLVHAGAAIHCWPTPSLGMAEITRVLKPGGKIIGSTFLLSASPLGQRLGSDDLVRPLFEIERELSGGMLPALTGRNYRFWEERELKALCSLCGLDHFRVERDNRFIMFCATKPDRKET